MTPTDVSTLEQKLRTARATLWAELKAEFEKTDLSVPQIATRARLTYWVALRALKHETCDAIPTTVIQALHTVLVSK